MKSERQHAYEVGVEYQLAVYRRSRKAHILARRFKRLVENLSSLEDIEWLETNLSGRFPELFKDKQIT